MATVYQHQLHAHKPRRRHYKRWALLLVLIIAVSAYGLHSLKPGTKIGKGVAHTQVIAAPQTKKWDEGVFTISLPADWKFIGVQHGANTMYSFQSPSAGDTANRILSVFVDSNLANLSVNRMVPVEAEGNGLAVNAGEVSDNCTAYTSGATTGRQTTGQLAKWQGIAFNCDMANYERNVVGTGSTDGMNTVKITGASGDTHHFFFTFTDNNNTPDYSIFTSALASFQVN